MFSKSMYLWIFTVASPPPTHRCPALLTATNVGPSVGTSISGRVGPARAPGTVSYFQRYKYYSLDEAAGRHNIAQCELGTLYNRISISWSTTLVTIVKHVVTDSRRKEHSESDITLKTSTTLTIDTRFIIRK
ncbi:hypothetical protein DPMN_074816 [Dreissena polymorpha]|uniref:Uncharacterized protein n=1 Tax=Dreissena polymorpha TaxID=45954 RepID=A0A9D3YFZ0_DREPO|nr:hypothetical protein DPMN_074816 [Dreissena polymorpha]